MKENWMSLMLVAGFSVSAAPLSKSKFLARVSCYPTLMSRFIGEKGYAKRVSVSYGDYQLVRTDIGDPDGRLKLSIAGKTRCDLPISVVNEVFLSIHDRLLVLHNAGAYGSTFQVYDLTKACAEMGTLDMAVGTDSLDPQLKELFFEQSRGDYLCQKKLSAKKP